MYNNAIDPNLTLLNLNLFSLQAFSAEIIIRVGGFDYTSDQTYNFGTTTFGNSSPAVTFTIENSGTGNLVLSGMPVIAGPEAADFIATLPASSVVAPGDSTTFTVTFTPGAVGLRNAALVIQSNDENESVYTINLRGTGSAVPVPNINLQIGGTDYPSDTSTYDFGEQLVKSPGDVTTITVTCTIENTGNDVLSLTGAPNHVIAGGTDPGDLIIAQPPVNTITPGGSATFSVMFVPGAPGPRSATITIPNSDSDENPYIINLTATGVMPVMVIHGNYGRNTSIYNPINNTFTFNAGNQVSDDVGEGAHSFPVPIGSLSHDGHHVVLHGFGLSTSTWYNPITGNFSAGPPTIYPIGDGAHSFPATVTIASVDIPGQLAVCGNGGLSLNFFNPQSDSFVDPGLLFANSPFPGPGAGGFSLPSSSGNTYIVYGNGFDYYQIWDQTNIQLDPSLPSIVGAPVVTFGAHSFLMPPFPFPGVSTNWLIIEGSSTTATWLYDAATSLFTPNGGNTLSTNPGTGAFSIPITDNLCSNYGRALIVHGGASNTTSIYNTAGTITPGPLFPSSNTIGAGAFAFHITGGANKGKYMIIHGINRTLTTIFDPADLGNFQADDPSDDLPAGFPAGAGAHCFPAK